MLVDTLAVSTMELADFTDEAFDQPGFAHPGLAGDQHDLTFAGGGTSPCIAKALQFTGAPNQWRRILFGRQWSGCARWCRGQRRRRADGADKAVSAARYGLDVTRVFGVVRQRCSQGADGRLECRVADVPMTPDGVKQGVLRDENLRRSCEFAQDGEHPGGQRHGASVAGQPCIAFVELESIEAKPQGTLHRGRHTCCHARLRLQPIDSTGVSGAPSEEVSSVHFETPLEDPNSLRTPAMCQLH